MQLKYRMFFAGVATGLEIVAAGLILTWWFFGIQTLAMAAITAASGIAVAAIVAAQKIK